MSEIIAAASGPQTIERPVPSTAPSESLGSEESRVETPEPASTGGDENVPRGTNGEQGDGRPKSAQQKKEESRYERTKREKAEFRQQRDAFRQQQAQFARERAEFEANKKPKRDYTLNQLKKYREGWAQEAAQGIDGREDLVRQADDEIKVMEEEEKASKMIMELPKAGTPEHAKQWKAAEAELYQADPEFMREGTRLDTRLREIFNGPNSRAYQDHPQGIYAAYDRAKRELLEEDVKGLRTENSQLKAENKRLNGLTSIGGGVPGRMGDGGVASTSDFAKLSTKDMRKHLLQNRGKNGLSSWL